MFLGARTLMKSALSNVRLRLERPTARELALIKEFRANCRQLPERRSNGASTAGDIWMNVANHFRYLVATRDPRGFLRWDHLRTMIFEDPDYVEPELGYLMQSQDWKDRWRPAIEESRVGQPNPFPSYPQSSGNLIHHAYHLCRFEETTGVSVDSFDLVVEFGGGYGSMCRLFHNLGFRGRYIIFDLAEFSCLQQFFLKSLGLPVQSAEDLASGTQGICTVSDFGNLKNLLTAISGQSQARLFVATWSLSEAPVDFRQQVLDLVSLFEAWLLAYQSQFGEINNKSYFAELAAQKEDFGWRQLSIDHIPEQFYLIGQRVTTGASTPLAGEAGKSTSMRPESGRSVESRNEAGDTVTPRVFVVIPTHNRWKEARETLAHLEQSRYRNFEIVLVDDGCTDGTVEHCRREFPDVQILHGNGELWWSGAINKGVDYALERGADAIVWLNDDNRVEPDTLSRLVESFKRVGAHSIICARTKSMGTGLDEWVGDPPRWHPDFETWKPPDLSAEDVPVEHPPGGRGVLIPAQCFREIGLVDSQAFPHYWADHDFHYRAMKAGYQYFIASKAVVWNIPNKVRPEAAELFSSTGARWFLFNRRSAMNMPTVRRLLKRHLPRGEYRRVFYPILFRHLLWLSYGWFRQTPWLYKPVHKVKKSFFGSKA